VQKITKFKRLAGGDADAFDQDARREYDSGKTIRAIVAESGRSYGAVHRALQRVGTRFRQRGGIHQHSSAGAAR
jgi:hypothetical protein